MYNNVPANRLRVPTGNSAGKIPIHFFKIIKKKKLTTQQAANPHPHKYIADSGKKLSE